MDLLGYVCYHCFSYTYIFLAFLSAYVPLCPLLPHLLYLLPCLFTVLATHQYSCLFWSYCHLDLLPLHAYCLSFACLFYSWIFLVYASHYRVLLMLITMLCSFLTYEWWANEGCFEWCDFSTGFLKRKIPYLRAAKIS